MNLKKQNHLASVLVTLPNDNNLMQLSQLIINQKLLLESLIAEISLVEMSSLYEHSFTEMQTKIRSYYNDYFQQQMLLIPMRLGYYLPNLNPWESEIQNAGPEEFHFLKEPSFVFTPYHNPQVSSTGDHSNNLISSDSVPTQQSTNKLHVSHIPQQIVE